MWAPASSSSLPTPGTLVGLRGAVAGDSVHDDLRPPQQTSELSTFDRWKCQLFGQNALKWWKVETLAHALSAMRAAPDFYCVRCPPKCGHVAGFSPEKNAVWICGNLVHNPFEFRRLLAHELVHAFDYARAHMRTREHLLCTEIRAWSLSGQCDLWVNFWKFLGDDMIDRKQRCVKENALLSVRQKEISAGTTRRGRSTASTLKPQELNTDSVGLGAMVEGKPGGSMEGGVKLELLPVVKRDGNITKPERTGAIDAEIFRQCYDDHWPFTAKAHLDTSWRKPARGA
ncbi:unnamed protein product [Amoebophrya sp. A120]|nr:unnamed protein product [Amoebophrya sp. A120]|eukprot:GSA120T00002060001.1